MPALDAVSPSDTCEYTLAKKKNGMNTADIRPSAAVSTAKARSPKIRRRSSGSGLRSSSATNATIRMAPMTMHAHVLALLHPQLEDCWSPSTMSPIAADDEHGAAIVQRGRMALVVELRAP